MLNVTICLFLTEAALAFCPLRTIAAPVSHTVPTSTVFTQHSFGHSTASGLRASNLAIKIRFPAQATHRLFSQAASGSGDHQHSKPKATADEGGRGVKLTTQIQAVLRLRMREAKSPLHHMPSWNTQGQLSHLISKKIHSICIVNGQHKYEMTTN